MRNGLATALLLCCVAKIALADTAWPTKDGVYTISNFHFGTGEVLPQMRLYYLTLGTPHADARGHTDNAVLLLHGTGGDAQSLWYPAVSEVLFGPGQPLDIRKYFIILPDDIGHGSSSKPSDGLHARLPHYDYDDRRLRARQWSDVHERDVLRLGHGHLSRRALVPCEPRHIGIPILARSQRF
jgi:homoserine acetyltransferase